MFKKSNLFILCFLANSLVGYAKTLTTSWVALRILAIMRNMRSTKNDTPMKKYILAILLMLCTNAYTFGQSKQHRHVDINYHFVFKKTYASFSENSICFSVHDDDSNAKMRRIEIEDTATIRKSLELGVSGYISKRSEPEVLNNALRLILEGGTYLPPSVLQPTAGTIVQDSQYRTGKTLTHRQNQVLGLVAQGLSNKQIAYEMGVSEATVKLHINALLRSVGATNRTQAVIMAQKMGII